MGLQVLELNGGRVTLGSTWRLALPPVSTGYADAQVDDYHGQRRRDYSWPVGTEMGLQARFSHGAGRLRGTAGFGFWNAPFGDPSTRRPALPRAVWFFYASRPSDLPLPLGGPGRGWFVSTISANLPVTVVLAPLAPMLLLMNRVSRVRRVVWPWVRSKMAISFRLLSLDMTAWHDYRLRWAAAGCEFWVDGEPIMSTPFRPTGPLGFVCWLDNQFLVATPTGRFKWGMLPVPERQWLEVRNIHLALV